jgi:hypothetical protein
MPIELFKNERVTKRSKVFDPLPANRLEHQFLTLGYGDE